MSLGRYWRYQSGNWNKQIEVETTQWPIETGQTDKNALQSTTQNIKDELT